MHTRQSKLPLLWLLSDARNDAMLDGALAMLPAGSGFVFRHYHLDGETRAARFTQLADSARRAGHVVVIAGEGALARAWGADGVYGEDALDQGLTGLVRLATAHSAEGIVRAAKSGADGVFLSPVFPTRSHPAATSLGIHGFHVLAQQSPIPVIALGGLTAQRAAELGWPRWAAIDGLSSHIP